MSATLTFNYDSPLGTGQRTIALAPAGPKGDTGDTGDAGPNTVTTATTTDLTGILNGDGANVGTATIGGGLTYAAGTLSADVTASSTTTYTNKTFDSFTNTLNADELHIQVRNTSGSTLTKGTPVYVSGYNVGQELVEVAPADASSASTMPCIGIVEADISNNATGSIDRAGRLSGLDTSAFSVGDELYVSETTGTLTATPPTGSAIVQQVATVLRSHATLGVLDVFAGAVPSTLDIGDTVNGGTAGRVLYTDSNGSLADSNGVLVDATYLGVKTGVSTALLGLYTGLPGLWLGGPNVSSPSFSNYALLYDGSRTILNAPSGQSHSFRIANTAALSLSSSLLTLESGVTIQGSVVTPAQITADTDNYAPGVARYYRLSTDASRTLTGLSVSQVDGQECEIWNVGSFNIVLKHQDTNSTAANRFLCDGGADYTLVPNAKAFLRYDSTTTRWRVSGALNIGDTVNGGTAGRVLYVGAGPVLADDAGLTYDSATDVLTVGGAIVLPDNYGAFGSLFFTTSFGNGIGSIGHRNGALAVSVGSSDWGYCYGTSFFACTSGRQYAWSSGSDATAGPFDTGLARAAAKVVGLTDGSTAGATLRSVPLTPAQITADTNNYAPGVAHTYRLSTDASRTVTGLSISQVDGQWGRIFNVGSNDLVLAHESGSSTAANRFTSVTGGNLTLSANEAAEFEYDGTTSRFRIWKL